MPHWNRLHGTIGLRLDSRGFRGSILYQPPQFEETRIDVLHALMRTHPLAALITLDDAGIVANHIPVETWPTPEPLGLLRGHIARANPLWRQHRADCEALAIFQGPQAYVSPSLYPSKQVSGKVVPTWDYAVVHARGILRFIHDAAWLRALVTRLTDAHEGPRPKPWKVDDAPAAYVDDMLAAIVGFELCIVRLAGKWKVSQNRDAADRQGVIAGLRAARDADSLEIADMLSSRNSAAKP
jgi:transcriptional regulator